MNKPVHDNGKIAMPQTMRAKRNLEMAWMLMTELARVPMTSWLRS